MADTGKLVRDGVAYKAVKSRVHLGSALQTEDELDDYIELYGAKVVLRGKVQLPDHEIENLGETVQNLRSFSSVLTVWAVGVSLVLVVLLLRNVFV